MTVFGSEVPEIKNLDSILRGSKRKEKTTQVQKGDELKKGEGKTNKQCGEKRKENTPKEKPQLKLEEYKESNQTKDIQSNSKRINHRLSRSKYQPILMTRSNRKQILNSSVDEIKILQGRKNNVL